MAVDKRQRSQHDRNDKKRPLHDTRGRGQNWFRAEEYTDQGWIELEDEAVNINGFLCPDTEGFKGTFKERFADFIVHEVDSQGCITQLTSIIKRKQPYLQMFKEQLKTFLGSTSVESQSVTEDQAEESIRFVCDVLAQQKKINDRQAGKAVEAYNYRSLIRSVTKELGLVKGKEFEKFIEKVKTRQALQRQKKKGAEESTLGFSSDDELVFYIGGLNEKHSRVFLHESIRRYGKKLVVAETVNTATKGQIIQISAVCQDANGKAQRENRRDWPVNLPDYLQFVLFKQNQDTLSVLTQLATQLHVPVSTFAYAETREKRGVTTQTCTVYRVQRERFQRFARDPQTIKQTQSSLIGNVCYVPSKFNINTIKGNHFSIVIREVSEDMNEDNIKLCVDSWVKNGFINFFSIQHFGNKKMPLQLLGRAVLRKDFKQAYILLLKPQEGEASKIREAREHYRKHKDVSAALRMFPSFLVAERAILEGLLKQGAEAHELAFQNIPEHLRKSYVAAYQKNIWNQMATKRITSYCKTSPILGDLVYACGKKAEQTKGEIPEVLILDESNVMNYSLKDVVLPIPGYAVQYPKNEIGQECISKLCTDGVQFEKWISHDRENKSKDLYDVKGSYRYLIQKPQNVSHCLKRYEDVTKHLLMTDLDRLILKQEEIASIENGNATGIKKAVILKFFLPTSSDAAIALRELVKKSSHQLFLSKKSALKEEIIKKADMKSNQQTAANSLNMNKKKPKIAIGRPGFSLGRF